MDFLAKAYYVVIVFVCAGMHESLSLSVFFFFYLFVNKNIYYNGCVLEAHVCMLTYSKRVFFSCVSVNVCVAQKHYGAFRHSSSHRTITQHDVTVHSAAQQVALGF